MTQPRYFESGSDFRRWLDKHHTTVPELLVGFRKAHVKNRGLTYAEALDAALCYGWIDGVRRSLGEETWTIRFTPRRRGSNWSLVNIRRMHELLADEVVVDAGRIVFGARDEAKSACYSYEQRTKGFDAAHEGELKRHKAEWEFYQSLPPSYRTAAHWVILARTTMSQRFGIGHASRSTSGAQRTDFPLCDCLGLGSAVVRLLPLVHSATDGRAGLTVRRSARVGTVAIRGHEE
ncbi:MAG: bacteriocin-protection protein [Gemmatimonadaceae bacterium]